MMPIFTVFAWARRILGAPSVAMAAAPAPASTRRRVTNGCWRGMEPPFAIKISNDRFALAWTLPNRCACVRRHALFFTHSVPHYRMLYRYNVCRPGTAVRRVDRLWVRAISRPVDTSGRSSRRRLDGTIGQDGARALPGDQGKSDAQALRLRPPAGADQHRFAEFLYQRRRVWYRLRDRPQAARLRQRARRCVPREELPGGVDLCRLYGVGRGLRRLGHAHQHAGLAAEHQGGFAPLPIR